MKLGFVYTDGVDVGEHHRPVDQKTVDALAESMSRVGLQSPILVYSPDNDTADLVAGQHRLEAARKLGWQQIDCFFVESDQELHTIDENLIRAELSPEQRKVHLRRRVQYFTTAPVVNSELRSRGRPTTGKTEAVKRVADEQGVHENTVWNAVRDDPPPCSEEPSNVVQLKPDNLHKFIRMFGSMSMEDKWRVVDWVEEWAATGREKRSQ